MDGGADRLHLAHALADSDALFVHGEVAVHILRQLLKGNGYGRAAAQGFHEYLVILHVPRKVRRQLRQGLACGLLHVEHHHGLVHGDLHRLFLRDNIAVLVPQGELGVGV